MPPTSASNVCSSTPRQTRRTCWIWTRLHGTDGSSRSRSAVSVSAYEDATLPVLQLSRHVQELGAVGGDGLEAAAESAVLPQAGGGGAPQGHLTHVQKVPDQLDTQEDQSAPPRWDAAAAPLPLPDRRPASGTASGDWEADAL